MIDRMKDLMIENGILQHQSNDWEAKYKHLLYEELPKLTAENESLILAIKKLIEERDMAINGVVHCKDCKYGSTDIYDHSKVTPIWCEYCDNYRNETDFCSRGVKKEMEDIKKYAEKEHIPTVNEGIEEPKMVVRCENCTHKDRVSDYCMCLNREIKPEDFCSLGIQK